MTPKPADHGHSGMKTKNVCLMKKSLLFLTAAFAVLALASCEKKEAEAPVKGNTNITIKARVAETKTHLVAIEDAGGVSYTANWDESGESLGLFLTTGALTPSDAPVELPGSKEAGEMVFHGSGSFADGTYNMMVYYPFSAYKSTGDGYIVGELLSEQHPIKGSFDPKCDLLGYSKNKVVVSGGAATIDGIELVRPMAILRINLNAESGDKAVGQKVTSLKMESLLPLTGTLRITNTGSASFDTPQTWVKASVAQSEGITVGGSDNSIYLIVAPVTIPKDASITCTLETEDYNDAEALVRTVTAKEAMAFEAGKVNVIDLKIRDKDVDVVRYAGGTGVEGDPFLIANAEHMVHMNEDLTNGKTLYFKLIDDIDMTGVTWVPANYVAVSGVFNKGVDFDGNNHKISNLDCASTNYPSLFGVLYGAVKDLTIDGANIHGSGKAGVLGGYLGTGDYSATVTNVTVQNSTITGTGYAGGLGGQVGAKSTITGCKVKNTTISSSGQRVGGMFGQLDNKGSTISNNAVEAVTLSGTNNVGGFVGVCYNSISDCTSTGGTVTHTVANSKEVSLGGFAGHIEGAAVTISGCSTSTVINMTLQGRSVGGFVGVMKGATIERCFATGDVIATYRNVGGFVGLMQPASIGPCTIRNCYSTGKVKANSYLGGFAGLMDAGEGSITDCYSSGDVESTSFMAGGFYGIIQSAGLTITHCAAWPGEVKAATIGAGNWSSGAFAGVAFPTCTLTDNYRNPSATYTMYWVPAADFQHPNVSSTHPLTDMDGNEMEDTGVTSNSANTHYPQYPYHGKSEPGKTLSLLASTTLGWSAEVWDFTGDLPVLK